LAKIPPLENAKVEIWEVNPLTGERVGNSPDFTFMTNAEGKYGPENIKANTTIEFVATPPNSSQRVIYYFGKALFTSIVWCIYAPFHPQAHWLEYCWRACPKLTIKQL
jgi:hypothetical protein